MFLIRVNLSLFFYLSKLIKIFGDGSLSSMYRATEGIDQSIEFNIIISQNQCLIEKDRLGKLFSSLSSFARVDDLALLEGAYSRSMKSLIVQIDILFEKNYSHS